MNNKIMFGIGGILIGLTLSLFLVPTIFFGYRSNNFGMMNWTSNQNPNQPFSTEIGNANNIDRHFIEQMIPHHDGAVAMAKLALEKSKRPEIINLSKSIIESQTKEIQDMNTWYKDWFGREVPEVSGWKMGGGMMFRGGMRMEGKEDIEYLEKADDFDKALIEAMIPHHQIALMMVRMLEVGSNKPEMLQLARNITESQSKEIKEMQTWYVQWYK